MSKSIEDLQVGDELFRVMTYGGQSMAKIKKIGKAYIHFEHGDMAHKDTLLGHAKGYCPGQFAKYYLSEAHYREEKELRERWDYFRLLVYNQQKEPELATIERINQCLEILGLSKKEEKK